MTRLARVVVCCSLLVAANSYPSGAPIATCGDLTPKHGPTKPQTSPSPYWTETSLKTLQDNQKLRLVLNSPDNASFVGFMVQARADGSSEPLGTFVTVPEFAKAITCGNGIKNTLTHKDNSGKKRIEFEWEPPEGFDGPVTFLSTYVQDGGTYWVAVPSEKVVVKRSIPVGDKPAVGISTTKIPIRVTTVPNYTPPKKPQAAATESPIYTGCGDTKLCFGTPDGCEKTRDCDSLVGITASPSPPNDFTFELLTTTGEQYIAVGLSDDAEMGSDNVMECTTETDALHMSTNSPTGKSNTRIKNIEDFDLKLVKKVVENGNIYCQFTRPKVLTVAGVKYDLQSTSYYLLLAWGPLSGENVGRHKAWAKTGSAVSLAETGPVASASNLLYRLHGAFMMAAWIGFAGTGMLIARYFRKTWVGKQSCGKDIWFAVHRAFMIITWVLTVAGFVIIFVQVDGWYGETSNPHAVLGTITTALCFIQPFAAYFRGVPGETKRVFFNWSHWGVGNTAHLLAVITIFFAKQLAKAELPDFVDWLISAYVAFHVVMHIILSIVDFRSVRAAEHKVNNVPMKEMGNGARSAAPPKKTDAPLSKTRRVLLGIYLFVVIALTIALTVIASIAPIEENETVKTLLDFVMPSRSAASP